MIWAGVTVRRASVAVSEEGVIAVGRGAVLQSLPVLLLPVTGIPVGRGCRSVAGAAMVSAARVSVGVSACDFPLVDTVFAGLNPGISVMSVEWVAKAGTLVSPGVFTVAVPALVSVPCVCWDSVKC